MNATGFVATVIVLAFATGFFVAAIIWFIGWVLSPKDELKMILNFFKANHLKFKSNLREAPVIAMGKHKDNLLVTEGSKNK